VVRCVEYLLKHLLKDFSAAPRLAAQDQGLSEAEEVPHGKRPLLLRGLE
jgi:hypothetical protein